MGAKNGGPSSNGSNGKDPATGRFTRGNKHGGGNPYANKVYALKQALINAVTADDIATGIRDVIALAKGGESEQVRLKAWELLFTRALGKADQVVEIKGGIDSDDVRTALLEHLRGVKT